jgi:hypothetical protein
MKENLPTFTIPLDRDTLRRFGFTIITNTLLSVAEQAADRYRVRVALGEPRDNNERALGNQFAKTLEDFSVFPKRKRKGRRARPRQTARNKRNNRR